MTSFFAGLLILFLGGIISCFLPQSANPKLVILCGACAISGGIYQNSDEITREFLEKYHIDLYIPGCPVHPLTFINGVLSIIK